MSRQVKKVNIGGKEDKSNKVSSWSNTTTDAHYPSEKLVKDSLDEKANSTHNHTKSQITDFPTSMTPSSHTHGNLQNNGQVGSTAQANKNVVTDSSGKITTEDKPTIPSASSTTPSADTTSGSYGSGTSYARSNHTHPKSSLYAESSHNHTKSQITDFPSIPSKTSDLQNDSGFLTSHQDISGKIDTAGTGLSKSGTTLNHSNSVTALTTASFKKVKYDSQGHITGTSDVGASDLPSHNHTKSQITDFPTIPSKTSDLTNDSGFLTSHQSLTGYLQTSDVKDNLTSTDPNKPLSANQGKELKALIDKKEDSNNKVSSWSSTTTDIHYPSEKLVKDSLDSKQDELVSGTNLKTLNEVDLLGEGDIGIDVSCGSSIVLFEDACSSASGLFNYGSSQLVRGTNATMTMSYDSTENAYKLSGSGNYHAMMPIPTLDDQDNYKISADFKAQNIQYNSCGFFLDNRNDTTSYGQAFYLNIYSKRLDGYTYKVSQDGTSSNSPTVSSLSANNYYRIEMIVSGSVLSAKLYDSNLNELTSTTHTLSVENKRMGIFLFCERGSTDSVCYVKNIKAEYLSTPTVSENTIYLGEDIMDMIDTALGHMITNWEYYD